MPKIERRHSLVLHQLIQGGIFFAFSISGGHWERQAYFRGAFFSAFSSSGGLFLGMMMFNKNARKKSGGASNICKVFRGALFNHIIMVKWAPLNFWCIFRPAIGDCPDNILCESGKSCLNIFEYPCLHLFLNKTRRRPNWGCWSAPWTLAGFSCGSLCFCYY